MKNGRGQGQARVYYRDDQESNVISINELTDTSGWAYYVGEMKDGWRNGEGKSFMEDGRVYLREWEMRLMKKGIMSYLQEDGTRKTQQETYDQLNDFKKGANC